MIVPELKTVGAVTMSVVFAGFLGNFYIEKRKCDQAKSLPYLRESFNLLRNDIGSCDLSIDVKTNRQ